MCVTWHLRQGVRWDDGSNLTSHDVCDTFDFHWLAYGAPASRARRRSRPRPAGTRSSSAPSSTGTRQSSTSRRSTGRTWRSGSGVDGILPAAVLDPVAGRRRQPRDRPRRAFDLTQGSGNAAAFKGTATLGHGARRHRAVRDVQLHARDRRWCSCATRLLEPERARPPRQAHLQDRARPRHRGEGRALRRGPGRA